MTTSVAVLDDVDTAIVNLIAACVAARGYPPSVREIGEAVGMTSTSSVHHRLRKLERAGVIRRAATRSRAITLVGERDSVADFDDEAPAA